MTTVVLAGGGTAGHTSPLIATAQALTKADPDIKIICIGTARGLETRVIPQAGLDLELIPAVPLPRKLSLDLLKVPFRLVKAINKTKHILEDVNADVVVGFGGYVSVPAYLAALLKKLPLVVHEQNMRPGIANKLAANFASRIFTTFPGTALKNSEAIGMPVREQITRLAVADNRDELARSARKELGLPQDLPVLLVSGGSQGARRLNIATVEAKDELLAKGISVLHVWGPKNFTNEMSAKTDKATGAKYQPVSYIDNMASAYGAANLMLARSGAGTVVEVATIGLPAIFVPLPIGNGEQELNARPVVQAGAGILIEDSKLDGSLLVAEVEAVRSKAEQMSKAGQKLMPARAADRLASNILELI